MVCSPVSPLLTYPALCCPTTSRGEEDVDDDVREEDAVLDEPIVGKEPKAPEDGVKALPKPREMTPKEFAEHCVKHIPYHEGCP